MTLGASNRGNEDTKSHIGYFFSEKQGYSKFGSYTGTNSTAGPFVYTGFKVAWIMIKRAGTQDTNSNLNGSHWVMVDNKRDPLNDGGTAEALRANLNAQVDTSNLTDIEFLSNGFRFRGGADAVNAADTYVYMAFAENPFVNSKGVPANAK